MNNSNIRDYLLNGLDPLPEQVSDTPFMSTLNNWIPSNFGIARAAKIDTASISLFTGLTGAASAPFNDVYCYSDYRTVVGATTYTNKHALCCESNGMLFFAKPSGSLVMTTVGARLYTPNTKHLFWCGAFNQGLGIALAVDSLLQVTIDTQPSPTTENPNNNLDHWQDMSCGYKTFLSAILGLHSLPNGAILVCTSHGLFRVFPTDFERFTFGEEHVTNDICNIPMSMDCLNPLMVNDSGETLLVGADGIRKLGYRQTLSPVVNNISRVTFDSFRNTYYICTNNYTYVLNDSGLWVLQQLVQAKTDRFEFANTIASLPTSVAETVPFTLGVEGIKSLKGVLLRYSGDVRVSFGFREQRGAPMQYTPAMEPDSRGAVNKVVTGFEFAIRLESSTASTTVSDIDVMWSNAVKTNFSQVSRRL